MKIVHIVLIIAAVLGSFSFSAYAAPYPPRLIIISANETVEQWQELIDFYNRYENEPIFIDPMVISVNSAVPAFVDQPQVRVKMIREYIRRASIYNDGYEPLSVVVVLAADTVKIPKIALGPNSVLSDNIYAYVDDVGDNDPDRNMWDSNNDGCAACAGDQMDYRADVVVTRVPFQTPTAVTAYVNKVKTFIEYGHFIEADVQPPQTVLLMVEPRGEVAQRIVHPMVPPEVITDGDGNPMDYNAYLLEDLLHPNPTTGRTCSLLHDGLVVLDSTDSASILSTEYDFITERLPGIHHARYVYHMGGADQSFVSTNEFPFVYYDGGGSDAANSAVINKLDDSTGGAVAAIGYSVLVPQRNADYTPQDAPSLYDANFTLLDRFWSHVARMKSNATPVGEYVFVTGAFYAVKDICAQPAALRLALDQYTTAADYADLWFAGQYYGVPVNIQATFIRGNVDGSVRVDAPVGISDPIRLLSYQFQMGVKPVPLGALDAADVNDDSRADGVGDAIYGLQYVFQHGDRPAPPFPYPWVDTTPDELRRFVLFVLE